MVKNAFTSVSDVTRKIGKNYYDWSHDYNFTGKIGTIYPVFAKYCPAGQSLSIDAVSGLQFMPMQFPVQSKMKMKISFWRMPLRAMWKDYTNLVSSQNQPDVQKNYVAPYIDFNHSRAYVDMLAVGGLCDYLRIPVTLQSSLYSSDVTFRTLPQDSCQVGERSTTSGFVPNSLEVGSTFKLVAPPDVSMVDVQSGPTASFGFYTTLNSSAPSVSPSRLSVHLELDCSTDIQASYTQYCMTNGFNEETVGCSLVNYSGGKVTGLFRCPPSTIRRVGSIVTIDCPAGSFIGNLTNYDNLDYPAFFLALPNRAPFWFQPEEVGSPVTSYITSITGQFSSDGVASLDKNNSPFYDSSSPNSDKQLKLSAYPFRMYEAIYNSYIRYIRNNPFKKDGKAVYNEWLPTMEGGADTTPYRLYRCNWAADAYTTAVQSPQQGVAPVVGLSQATVLGEDGVSRVVPAITTEDGKSYGIEFKANEFGLEGVDYTELGTGAKVAPVHSMYSLAQSGISIEDFRMTNAYQRYLELNMMRGYSYKQIVEGRFEVNVKYDALLMPEFCGGMTRDVFVSGVQQNVEDNGGSGTYVGSLGSEAGIAGCRGDLGHKVKIYCDEPSYVMALAYVVPQSIYSQVCPKDFLYRDLLDAWSPEFDQIGFQPIKNSELCPVQAWNASPDRLNDTFGFQRPWYEYCEVLDASVGLFNTEMRNFLMHRLFSSTPVLGERFTTVSPESVDHVFSVTEFTDKFFGQIHFSIDVKSPVSRVVIPSLE